MAMGKAFLQTQQRDIVAIGRAAGDLRRGLPVLIAGDMGAEAGGKARRFSPFSLRKWLISSAWRSLPLLEGRSF